MFNNRHILICAVHVGSLNPQTRHPQFRGINFLFDGKLTKTDEIPRKGTVWMVSQESHMCFKESRTTARGGVDKKEKEGGIPSVGTCIDIVLLFMANQTEGKKDHTLLSYRHIVANLAPRFFGLFGYQIDFIELRRPESFIVVPFSSHHSHNYAFSISR